ncbi:MAG: hypothetical protein RTU92_11120 [Candidatus Thorarchaeota archaeon]
MRAILVIDEGGVPSASVGFEELDDSAPLFGSFISAMQLFAKAMSGTDVKELTFQDFRIMFGPFGLGYVITIHSTVDPEAEWNHEVVVGLVEEQEYSLDTPFLNMLRELLTQKRITHKEAEICIDMLLGGERFELPKGD